MITIELEILALILVLAGATGGFIFTINRALKKLDRLDADITKLTVTIEGLIKR